MPPVHNLQHLPSALRRCLDPKVFVIEFSDYFEQNGSHNLKILDEFIWGKENREGIVAFWSFLTFEK